MWDKRYSPGSEAVDKDGSSIPASIYMENCFGLTVLIDCLSHLTQFSNRQLIFEGCSFSLSFNFFRYSPYSLPFGL